MHGGGDGGRACPLLPSIHLHSLAVRFVKGACGCTGRTHPVLHHHLHAGRGGRGLTAGLGVVFGMSPATPHMQQLKPGSPVKEHVAS